jgi:hypothetical protein
VTRKLVRNKKWNLKIETRAVSVDSGLFLYIFESLRYFRMIFLKVVKELKLDQMFSMFIKWEMVLVEIQIPNSVKLS